MQEREARLARLQLWLDKGRLGYDDDVNRTHTTADFLHTFIQLESSGASSSVAGRVIAIRQVGKLSFLRLKDFSGELQIVVRVQELGEIDYKELLEYLDIGDIAEFTGKPMTTKSGEKSLLVDNFKLLVKALAPLPEKWHGLQDVEIRFRQRELDLISRPDAKRIFLERSKLIASIRKQLAELQFIEVETPVLQPIAGGANAKPFVTHHNALSTDLFLRIAPEIYLKRLVVGGFEKIFEIARCFRNEGIGFAHNPEFTMLELYWAYVRPQQFLEFLEKLIKQAVVDASGRAELFINGETVALEESWPKISFSQAVKNACGIDPVTFNSQAELEAAVKNAGLDLDFKGCFGLGEAMDSLYKATARPLLLGPIWVTDYPSEIKPLAKPLGTNPKLSATAQLVVGGTEIVNVYYHEQNDPAGQRSAFSKQQLLRERGSEEAQSFDEEFIQSLETGLPPCAGVGIGIDRLATFVSGCDTLKEVILFPTLKRRD